ncbi:MAG: hypothetical protein VKQ33_01405 [Candidatus Sericytochromatia bacterium]|nr:hypothetical protein [Candidatus Sericytochromatia bacterium]
MRDGWVALSLLAGCQVAMTGPAGVEVQQRGRAGLPLATLRGS